MGSVGWNSVRLFGRSGRPARQPTCHPMCCVLQDGPAIPISIELAFRPVGRPANSVLKLVCRAASIPSPFAVARWNWNILRKVNVRLNRYAQSPDKTTRTDIISVDGPSVATLPTDHRPPPSWSRARDTARIMRTVSWWLRSHWTSFSMRMWGHVKGFGVASRSFRANRLEYVNRCKNMLETYINFQGKDKVRQIELFSWSTPCNSP